MKDYINLYSFSVDKKKIISIPYGILLVTDWVKKNVGKGWEN